VNKRLLLDIYSRKVIQGDDMKSNNVLVAIIVVLALAFVLVFAYKNKIEKQDEWGSWNVPRSTNVNPAPIPDRPQPITANPTSYEEAVEACKQTGKPIFLYFEADWCAWCKRMKKETFSDPKVSDVLKGYIVYFCNQEKEPELAKKYGVKSLPTYFIVGTGNGKTLIDGPTVSKQVRVIKQGKGYRPPAAFLTWIGDNNSGNESIRENSQYRRMERKTVW
jgi:thioredoxin-related protein